MADLTEHQQSKTALAIYQHYEDNQDKDRPHLGASQIGEDCERLLWYSFHHALPRHLEGRVLRLFETGHREEDRIKDNLRAIGVVVYDKDDDGKQFGFSDIDGHFAGSVDGVLENVPEAPKKAHLFEGKSANQKAHNALKKHGVQKSKPVHYAQMQIYMGELKLTRALYVSACKNTDELYVERVRFDRNAYKQLLAKAERIIRANEPLERISDDPKYYQCSWCDFKELCHGTRPASMNCRTCSYSTPAADGAWSCERHGVMIDGKETHHGCDEHILLPYLMPYAEAIDAGEGWVRYKVKTTGREFLNVASEGFPADAKTPHYTSTELANVTNPAVIGEPTVEAARVILNGEIVETRDA